MSIKSRNKAGILITIERLAVELLVGDLHCVGV